MQSGNEGASVAAEESGHEEGGGGVEGGSDDVSGLVGAGQGGGDGAEDGEDACGVEYSAAVADEDMRCDQDKAWKSAEITLRRMELLAVEKGKREAEIGAVEGMAGAEDRDLSARMTAEAERLKEALKKIDPDRLREGIAEAERHLQETAAPPGVAAAREAGAAPARAAEGARWRVVVPSGSEMVSMFTPQYWTGCFPVCFPYGDGVFGVEREARLTYEEWYRCLLARDELEYSLEEPDHGEGEYIHPRAKEEPAPPPRWRTDVDLVTAMYCLWRRKAFIKGAREFVQNQHFGDSIRLLVDLKPQDLYGVCTLLGKGSGVKEAMQSAEVPPAVKNALRAMTMSNSAVVGSDAHRTTLRHTSVAYRMLFGVPLVFTTPNVADTRSPLMSLLYEGAHVRSWRLLEEHAPRVPSVEEMLRRVAADPVSQAMVFDVMLRLFLEHVLGVVPHGQRPPCSDGVASSGAAGIFGFVRAYIGPVETQGRGGLHPHMSVWVLHPITGSFLARVRDGAVEDLESVISVWRQAVLAKVASMQFTSVEEVARQLRSAGVPPAAPLPLSEQTRGRAFMDGKLEDSDLLLEYADGHLPPRGETPPVPQGPRRQRQFAPLADPEPDPHEAEATDWRDGRRRPLTGAVAALLPAWRRKPPFQVRPDGSAEMWQAETAEEDASKWAKCFSEDSRACHMRSHLHRCMNTCFKYAKDDDPKSTRICRFGFYHAYETATYVLRRPRQQCSRQDCPMRVCTTWSGEQFHPFLCPPPAAQCKPFKRLRTGKALVLPRRVQTADKRNWTFRRKQSHELE